MTNCQLNTKTALIQEVKEIAKGISAKNGIAQQTLPYSDRITITFTSANNNTAFSSAMSVYNQFKKHYGVELEKPRSGTNNAVINIPLRVDFLQKIIDINDRFKEVSQEEDIAELGSIQEASEEVKKTFNKGRQAYVFTDHFNLEEQASIQNQIVGFTLSRNANLILNGKPTTILDKEKRFGAINLYLAERERLKKIDGRTASEEKLLTDLNVLLSKDVWELFESAALREIRTKGYKINSKRQLISKEEGLKQESLDKDNFDDDFVDDQDISGGQDSQDGKSNQTDDFSALTTRMKDTMSSHLRTFLSGIPSTRPSFMQIGKYTTDFVGEDITIQAINEATLGYTTLPEMIMALREYSKIKGREFLSVVADKIEEQMNAGTKIAAEFGVKFNQQYNNLLLLKYAKGRRVLETWKNAEGETGTSYVKNKEGLTIPEFTFQVINVNRQNIEQNIKQQWADNLRSLYDTKNDVISEETKKKIFDEYKALRDSLATIATEGVLHDIEATKAAVKNLLLKVGIEMGEEALNRVMSGQFSGPKFEQYFVDPQRTHRKVGGQYIDVKGKSVFGPRGFLRTIFDQFGKEDVTLQVDDIYKTTGAFSLASTEALFAEQFLNTSVLDGKGRNIWSYGLPNPLTREFNKIVKDKEYAKSLQTTLYTKNSTILDKLATLTGTELIEYKDALKYGVFSMGQGGKIKDVTTGESTGSKDGLGKELTNTNPREFFMYQLGLLMGTPLQGSSKKFGSRWSYKFLTTPSDKSTMYMMQTPDHAIDVTFKDGEPATYVQGKTVARMFNYFMAEYDRVNDYLTADADKKARIDELTNYEPRIFYNFPQFNLKSGPDSIWQDGKLKPIAEVEALVKATLKKQLEVDILNTYSRFSDLGLIKDGQFIMGIDPKYLASLPQEISHSADRRDLFAARAQYKGDTFKEAVAELSTIAAKNATTYLVADYAINYQFHNMEMEMLFLGDPAQFLKDEKGKLKDSQFQGLNEWSDINTWRGYIDSIRDNMSKRMAGIQASGAEGQFAENDTSNTVVLYDDDPKRPMTSKIYDELNDEQKANYKRIKTMDGSEIITAEEDLKDKLAYGKITKDQYNSLLAKVKGAHADIEKTGEVSEANKFSPEEKFIAQAQKPVVFALIPDSNLHIRKATYYKSAAFALYPQFTQGFEIDKLREAAYNLEKKGKRIDRFVMISAAKLGAKNPIKGTFTQDDKGALRLDTSSLMSVDDTSIDLVPREYFRIQLEVPYDAEKDHIRMASQQVKLIFNEIRNLKFPKDLIKKFVPELGDDVTGHDLHQYHDKLFKELLSRSGDKLFSDLGVKYDATTGVVEYSDLEKLRNILLDQAIDQDYGQAVLDGLKLTEDKKGFVVPLAFSATRDRFEKLLLSTINKVILQKISGRSFILATEQGFVPKNNTTTLEGKEAKDFINKHSKTNIVWVTGKDGESKFDMDRGLLPVRKNPENPKELLPAQVLVTFKFKDNDGNTLDISQFITEKDGKKFLDTEKIDTDILRILGIRIPTQGHPSMASVEIVGFLPEGMGDLVIAPQDWTTQFGSDFDIDKLYGYMYNYRFNSKNKSTEKLDKVMENLRLAHGINDEVGNLSTALFKYNGELKELQKNKFSSKEFKDFILDNINTNFTEVNNTVKIGEVPTTKQSVIDYFNSLTEDELKAINVNTYKENRAEEYNDAHPKDKPISSLEATISQENLGKAAHLKKHITAYNAHLESKIATLKESISATSKNILKELDISDKGLTEDQIKKGVQEARSKVKKSIATYLKEREEIYSDKKLELATEDMEGVDRSEIIQNKLQDIYHAIMLHPTVHDKALAGIQEGNLKRLAKELSAFDQKLPSEYYSPASALIKSDEFFANQAGKLGVGIFSIANTFFTIIEGKNISMHTVEVLRNGTTVTRPNPFIIKDSNGNPREFTTLSGGLGANYLISIFQSASVDNAKLGYLGPLHQNAETMGITAVMAGLADDSVVDSEGNKVLNEDYIAYWMSQPIIKEFVSGLQTGSDETQQNQNKNWKVDLESEVEKKYQDLLKDASTSSTSKASNLSGTFYEMLGVDRTATEKEIKKAYKTYASENHPDPEQDPELKQVKEENMKKVNHARDILLNPSARAVYDSRLDSPNRVEGALLADTEEYPGYTLEELKTFMDQANQNSVEYYKAQIQILRKFLELKAVAQEVRNMQYAINADSKGVPKSLDEAMYKKDRIKAMSNTEKENPYLSNVFSVFYETDEDGNLLLDDGVPIPTLQGLTANLSVDLPINLYSGIENGLRGVILPAGSPRLQSSLDEIRLVSGMPADTQYNAKLGKEVSIGMIAYMQSTRALEVVDPGKSIYQERLDLLEDREGENTSLATDIEEFKRSEIYENSLLLRPLFNSIKSKYSSGLKFAEFKAATGLTSPDEQIIQALEYLRTVNYPLFERLVKYQLLLQGSQSPVNFRKFIPIYYLEAIGVAAQFRALNMSFGVPTDTLALATQYFQITRFTEQFFQHNPVRVKTANLKFVTLASDRTSFTVNADAPADHLTIKVPGPEGALITVRQPYSTIVDMGEIRLYRFNYQTGVYNQIDLLGDYNLDEYDSDKGNARSILDPNKATGAAVEEPTATPGTELELPFKETKKKEAPKKETKVDSTQVVDDLKWGDIKDLPVYSDKGVSVTRKQGTNEQFGNPFRGSQRQGVHDIIDNITTFGTIAEASQAYKDWLEGTAHQNVEPERRAWILAQINEGKLDGKKLLYYKPQSVVQLDKTTIKGGYYSHADVLADIVNARPRKPNPANYTIHSGGALKKKGEANRRQSADLVFEDIGHEFGVKTRSYTFKGHDSGSRAEYKVYTDTKEYEPLLKEAEEQYIIAAGDLKRNVTTNSYIKGMMLRNWFQVKDADAVFAVGKLVGQGTQVDGGTGYAVQMAINNGKPVYVFNQNNNKWYEWKDTSFELTDTPTLTPSFAGIGTREITDKGVEAVRTLFNKTFKGVKVQGTTAAGEAVTKDGTFMDGSKLAPAELLKKEYNYDKTLTGEENAKRILKSIADRSTNAMWKELANILLKTSEKTDLLENLTLDLDSKLNQYERTKHTVNVSLSDNTLGNFDTTFQYNFLHELVHAFTINTMHKDTTYGKEFTNRVIKLMNSVIDPEHIEKLIEQFNLKQADNFTPATVDYVFDRLQTLRTADVNREFLSEAERAALNGLIDPREFVSMIMTEGRFQKFLNSVGYRDEETSPTTGMGAFLKFLNDLFNKFINAFGFTVEDGTALKEGLGIVTDILQFRGNEEFFFKEAGTEYRFLVDGDKVVRGEYQQAGQEWKPLAKKTMSEKFKQLKDTQDLVDSAGKEPVVDKKEPTEPVGDVQPEVNTGSNSFTFKDGVTIDTGRIKLNAGQREALQLMADAVNERKTKFVLKGYAGTGKSTIISYLVKYVQQTKPSKPIIAGTPTHKAVSIIKAFFIKNGLSSIKEYTVAKMLNARYIDGKFVPGAYPKVPNAGIVIVDESSMANAEDYYNLMDLAEDKRSTIIFMGDPAQIPPVSTGAWKMNYKTKQFVVDSQGKKIWDSNAYISPALEYSGKEGYELTEVMRQKDGNPLIDILTQIRADITSRIDKFAHKTQINSKGEGIRFVKDNRAFTNAIKTAFGSSNFKEDKTYAKVITYTNASVYNYNQMIRTAILDDPNTPYQVGEILMGYVQGGSDEAVIHNGNDYVITESREAEVDYKLPTAHMVPGSLSSYKELDVKLKLKGFRVTVKQIFDPEVTAVLYKYHKEEFNRTKEETDELYTNTVFIIDPADAANNQAFEELYKTKEFLANKKIKWADKSSIHDEFNKFNALHQIPDQLVKFYGKPVTTLGQLRAEKPQLFIRQADGSMAIEKLSYAEFEKNIDYGYAISAHKSQGSTYHTVFSDLDNIKNPLNLKPVHDSNGKVVAIERNNLNYVALSRTSHDVVAYSRLAEEDLDIAKLSSVVPQTNPTVNRPTPSDPSSGPEQQLTQVYLEEKLKFLAGKMRRIGKDKQLTQDQKDEAIKLVKADQERIKTYLQDLEDNPEIIEFDRVATKDLNAMEAMLTKQALSIDESLEIAQGLKFYKIIYRQLDRYFKDNLDFELRDAIERHNNTADRLMTRLKELASTQFVGQYNEDTGKTYSIEEMLASEDNSSFRNYLINSLQNKNTFVRMMGKTIGAMYKQTEAAIQEHQVLDNRQLSKYLKKFVFNDITKLDTYDDEFGREKKEKNFLSRNTITYFNTWNTIFNTAANKTLFPDTQAGRKAKSEYIANEINKISHSIDIRFLYPEVHNQEHPSSLITDDQGWEYERELLAFYLEQFADYGEEYAIKRYGEVLDQAETKIQEYFLQKEAYELVLDAENDPSTRDIKMRDWLAYNSPFTLLNEQIGFKDSSGNYVKHPTAKTSKIIQVNTASGQRNENAYVEWSQRGSAKDAIVRKANNLYENGNNTGFYDEDFLNMEAEHFIKQDTIAEMQARGEDTSEIEADVTKWEFLNWAIETQKYYMAKFPGYLKNELRYNSLIDIKKGNEEVLNSALTEVELFNKLRLIPLGLNKVWDTVINTVSEKSFEERENRLDYITEQVKEYYNPHNISNTLNKQGKGDRKTEDAQRYFEILRATALEYEAKSEYESFIKLGEFLMNSADFTPKGKPVGIKGSLGDSADLVRWTVRNKLYGARRESEPTKKFVYSSKWALTKKERDEVNDLETQIKELSLAIASGNLSADERRRASFERDQASLRLSKIKREVSTSTVAKTSLDAIRFHFMSWGTVGRAVDFFNSGVIGNIYEAADGRIFGFKDFSYGFGYIMGVYGLHTLGGNLIVGSGVSLLSGGAALPFLAAGAAARAAGAAINAIALQKQKAKISQLLWRFGALENFHNLSDGNVSGFAMRNNIASGAKTTLKLLLPYTPMEETEIVNKGISTVSALHGVKILNKTTNKEVPLVDAFVVNDELDLVWDEANFGSQEDAGYNWADGKLMHKAKGLVDAATRNANGDYGSHTALGADKESLGKVIIFLRRFLAETIQRRLGDAGTGFGKRWEDEESGMSYVPRYTSWITALQERRNNGTWDGSLNEDTKAAGKQVMTEIAMWIGLASVLYILRAKYDKDKEYSKFNAFITLMGNILGKSYAEQTQLVNPNVMKSRSLHGLHPYISILMDMGNIGADIWKAMGPQGDIMSRQEMISNGLLVPNPSTRKRHIPRHRDKNGKWIQGKDITDYKQVGQYKEKSDRKLWSTDAHYPVNYKPESRLKYHVQNLLFPGSIRSTKRAVTKDLKIK